jgi:hypothetical protein
MGNQQHTYYTAFFPSAKTANSTTYVDGESYRFKLRAEPALYQHDARIARPKKV